MKAQVAVVMVPLPAQGHLNQLLHLSRLISSYNIPVHYVCTAAHGRQAKARVHGWDPLANPNINFHEFPTPPFPNPAPDPEASIKFPNQLMPAFFATSHLRDPVNALVRRLQSSEAKRVAVIYDSVIPWVVRDVPSIPNAKCYCFNSVSVFTIYAYYLEAKGKPAPPGAEILESIPSLEYCVTPELRHQCLDWLDKQGENSVLFVSFGSTTSLPDEQIKELAIGLEKSGQKFIWVIRDADKGDVFTGKIRTIELPEGYEDLVQGRGIIIRDWAPQLEILAHPSTGGFMSHCGWNSCMESISMGVPIAAWPMHSDQPRNSVLITNMLKVGVPVRDWARRGEIVSSDMIQKAVEILMASAEGEEMRRRAAELGGAVKKSVVEGGVTRAEMDSFVAHICT